MDSFRKDGVKVERLRSVSDLGDTSTSASSGGSRDQPSSAKFPSDLLKLVVEKKHEQAIHQLFDLVDTQSKNVLSPDEIFLFLKNTSQRMNVTVDDSVIRAAVRTLVKEVGIEDPSMSITREQFYDIFHRNPDMFCIFDAEDTVSFQFPSSKYRYVLNRQDVEENEEDEDEDVLEKQVELWERAKTRMEDRGTEMIWLLAYLAANIATFVHAALKWASNEDATNLLGNCVIVARSSAAVLNLNGALILFPISRYFLTRLRGTFLRFIIPFDACLDFHMLVGIVFCIFSASHVLAHICDYTRVVKGNESDIVALFGDALGDIPESKSGRLTMALKEPVTITGVIMVICLCVAVWALRQRHRRDFNRFWYLHHLFILMLILMCVHGVTSLLQHYQSVYWVCGPFALYAIPRLYRECKCRTAKVLSATIHGDVLEIELEKPIGWQSLQRAGMYAYLNIPCISRLEWHPFAMSSSPNDNHIKFHIKVIGDWTEEAMKTVQESLFESGSPEGDTPFSVRIDGPIGASFQDYRAHEVVVLIGAGIGVTVRALNCSYLSVSPFSSDHSISPNSSSILYSLS